MQQSLAMNFMFYCIRNISTGKSSGCEVCTHVGCRQKFVQFLYGYKNLKIRFNVIIFNARFFELIIVHCSVKTDGLTFHWNFVARKDLMYLS